MIHTMIRGRRSKSCLIRKKPPSAYERGRTFSAAIRSAQGRAAIAAALQHRLPIQLSFWPAEQDTPRSGGSGVAAWQSPPRPRIILTQYSSHVFQCCNKSIARIRQICKDLKEYGPSGGDAGELVLIEPPIAAFGREQLVVVAHFSYAAVFNNNDVIRVPDGG